MKQATTMTIGMDLGDKYSRICVLDEFGEIVEESQLATTKTAINRYFGRMDRTVVAIEVGTHSRWISQLLLELGHQVFVANPRKVKAISSAVKKNDRIDARMLAELAFAKPSLLCPIQHRGQRAQQGLLHIQTRDELVRKRTDLANHVRGICKSMGQRLPKCSSESVHKRLEELPEGVQEVLEPTMRVLEALTEQIRVLDKKIEQLCLEEFPETQVLQQVNGVGPITSLAFVTVLEDPERFRPARDLGGYLGLVPRLDESCTIDKELPITKAGNPLLRRLLVQCAHYILGPHGADSDLRRWGLKLAAKGGGKKTKKRAVVATARKLAQVLLSLWKSGAVYDPLYNSPDESSSAETSGEAQPGLLLRQLAHAADARLDS